MLYFIGLEMYHVCRTNAYVIPRHFVSVERFALCVCASLEAFRSLTVIGNDHSIFSCV